MKTNRLAKSYSILIFKPSTSASVGPDRLILACMCERMAFMAVSTCMGRDSHPPPLAIFGHREIRKSAYCKFAFGIATLLQAYFSPKIVNLASM